jgi:hypothetical protein
LKSNTETLGNISQHNTKQKKQKNQLPTSSKSKQRELSIPTFMFSCQNPRSHGPSEWTPAFYLHIASLLVYRLGARWGDPFHIHSNGSGTMIKSISFSIVSRIQWWSHDDTCRKMKPRRRDHISQIVLTEEEELSE